MAVPIAAQGAASRPPGIPPQARAVKAPGVLHALLFRLKPDRRVGAEISALTSCGLFEPSWYLERYPDVAEAGAEPARHYLFHGAGEGRDPGPHFSTSGYLSDHPDVADAGLNPLVHFAFRGLSEGRRVRPSAPIENLAGALTDPAFDIGALPESCLPAPDHRARDLWIGPTAQEGALCICRAELLSQLAFRPPARLIIDWHGLQSDPGEWAGLWQLDDMTLNRQIMDACRIGRDRHWRIAVRGRVDARAAPLFATVSGLVGSYMDPEDGP